MLKGPWYPANHGSSKLRWFLIRNTEKGDEYLYTAAGNLRRFGSAQTAQKAADRLNREEADGPDQADAGPAQHGEQ